MEQWEQAYNKWFMANYEPKIMNTLDKHSEMSSFDINKRLQDAHREIDQQMFMRDFFKALYQKQEAQKGVIQIDEKDIDKSADKVVELLQQSLNKRL